MVCSGFPFLSGEACGCGRTSFFLVAFFYHFVIPFFKLSLKRKRRWEKTHNGVCFLLFFFFFFLDPAVPQVIRPPPPDLVQQHSPLPTPALGNSPVHRPSPSPSPPYVKTQQSGPGRPAVGITTFRERRNSTSSVSTSKTVTSITSVERGISCRKSEYFPGFLLHVFTFFFSESYNANLHTPSTNLNAMTSPRPDVTHLSGGPPVLPPTGPNTARGRNPLRRDFVHRKDSIKEVLQPSLSDPENPPK